jgi:hypothetical protein
MGNMPNVLDDTKQYRVQDFNRRVFHRIKAWVDMRKEDVI